MGVYLTNLGAIMLDSHLSSEHLDGTIDFPPFQRFPLIFPFKSKYQPELVSIRGSIQPHTYASCPFLGRRMTVIHDIAAIESI